MTEFTREDWEGYIEQIKSGMKVNKMARLTDKNTLQWCEKQLAKLPKEVKKSAPISSSKSNTRQTEPLGK